MIDEIKLLEFKVQSLERNILTILKDINQRLNRLEDEINEIKKY